MLCCEQYDIENNVRYILMSTHEFIVYTGAMFAGKTTKLMLTLDRMKYQNRKVVAFKPMIDSRYSVADITTHMGWKYPAHVVAKGADILKFLADSNLDYEVIVVDEQFMIQGSADVLIWLFKKGFTIVVSTLDLSATGKPFEEVQKILPFATQIDKCISVCSVCGSNAYYTHKKVKNDDEIVVGGSELYEPRCFKHFTHLNDVDEFE